MSISEIFIGNWRLQLNTDKFLFHNDFLLLEALKKPNTWKPKKCLGFSYSVFQQRTVFVKTLKSVDFDSVKYGCHFQIKYQVAKVSPGGSHLAPRSSSHLAPVRTLLQLAPNGELGASWSETSEPNVILGFRVFTTIGRKTSIITYSAYVSPPPGCEVPIQCPLT